MARDTDKIVLKPITEEQKKGKNIDGSLGSICNNCGGLGWTLGIKGGNIDCSHCDKTGITTMTRQELQKEIAECKEMIRQIIQQLIDEKVILKGVTFSKGGTK